MMERLDVYLCNQSVGTLTRSDTTDCDIFEMNGTPPPTPRRCDKSFRHIEIILPNAVDISP